VSMDRLIDKEGVVYIYIFTHMHVTEWEKAMAPHSSTLAWKIPWTGLHFHFSLSCTGEGNGNPFQCSCLENPRDGRAWWAAVYGVTQSRTQLKRLISSMQWNSQFSSVQSLSHVRFCDLMNRITQGIPVHGIFQARVLEWGAIAFSHSVTCMCVNIYMYTTPSLSINLSMDT